MLRPSEISVAIVGAGVAGLNCAARLMSIGTRVRLYDRGRTPGGRARRRREGPWRFDHGAPEHAELVRRLAAGLAIESSTRITSLATDAAGRWYLTRDGGPVADTYDFVVLAMPPEQAIPLLVETPGLARVVARVKLEPRLATMVGFPRTLASTPSECIPASGPLASARRQVLHGSAPAGDAWVLQGTAEFSRDNLECDLETVARHLLHAFADEVGSLPPTSYLRGHRWRYARTDHPLGMDCLFDSTRGIGVCGDWCRGDDVFAALLSGRAMAARIAATHELPHILDERLSRETVA